MHARPDRFNIIGAVICLVGVAVIMYAPFREAFPDVTMTVVDLVAEDDKVAARFTCSATQQSEWQGRPGSGARFERVDEVYFFRFRDGQIVHILEDDLERMQQLGYLDESNR